MAIDPVGLDFDLVSKVLDKPAKTATVLADLYWNGVKRGTIQLVLDASGHARQIDDFSYAVTCWPVP